MPGEKRPLRNENRPEGQEAFQRCEQPSRGRPVESEPVRDPRPHHYDNPLIWTTGPTLEPTVAVTVRS